MKVEHGTHMRRAGFAGGLRQFGVLRRVFARSLPARHAPAGRQVAVDDVVRRGLVGHDVGPWAAGLGPPHHLGQQLGGVAAQADGYRLAGRGVPGDQRQGFVQVRGLLVEVAGAQPEVDAALLAFDVEGTCAGKAGCQRLRAAHAAKTSGEHPAPAQIALKVLTAGLDKGLVGALHNALGADVDPAAGGHLTVHHQASAVELIEVLPVGPLGHQVRVGQQHARRPGVGAKHADRLA